MHTAEIISKTRTALVRIWVWQVVWLRSSSARMRACKVLGWRAPVALLRVLLRAAAAEGTTLGIVVVAIAEENSDAKISVSKGPTGKSLVSSVSMACALKKEVCVSSSGGTVYTQSLHPHLSLFMCAQDKRIHTQL
jgi:hypothetical protein